MLDDLDILASPSNRGAKSQQGGPSAAASRKGAGLVRSADRALDILSCFSEQAESLSLQEIVARTRIPRSSIYRFLKQLVARRFLVELADPDQKVYAIGPTIIRLGKIGLGEAMLRRHAYPTM